MKNLLNIVAALKHEERAIIAKLAAEEKALDAANTVDPQSPESVQRVEWGLGLAS
jgi:hypothetical protein